MDPKACLVRLTGAIDSRDWSEAVQALADYYLWRTKGGGQPMMPAAGDDYAQAEAARLADALDGAPVAFNRLEPLARLRWQNRRDFLARYIERI